MARNVKNFPVANAPATRPPSRRWRIWLTLAAAVVLLGAGGFASNIFSRTRAVASIIPDHPRELIAGGLLAAQIAEAERSARGWSSAMMGVAQLGRLYQVNGYLAEASQIWDGLARLEPTNPRWPYFLGGILAGYGRLEEAIPLWERTVKLAPSYTTAQVRLGEILLKARRSSEAAKLFATAVKQDPANPYARLGLARIDFDAERWSEARATLSRITTEHPDFAPAWSLLVTVDEKLGETAEAALARDRSKNSGLRMMPDPWVDALLADCYDPYRLNVAAAAAAVTTPAEAMALLRRALEVDASNATSHRLLGEELKKSGDLVQARSHFERAAELEPDADVNWNTLVAFLRASGDNPASERALSRGLLHCPDSPGLLLERISRYTEQSNFRPALALLNRLKQLHPDEAEYPVKAAILHFQLEEVPEGMAEMQRALTLKPDHPIALLALARNAVQNGDQAAARELIARIRRHLQINPQDTRMVIEEFQARFNHAP